MNQINSDLVDLQVGQVVKGTLTHIREHYAEVLVHDIHCILPISEMNWMNKSCYIPTLGSTIEAVVVQISQQGVMLSMKRAIPNPWKKYSVGQQVNAIISKVMPYGVFAELEPKFSGLYKKNDIKRKHHDKIENLFKVGQEIELVIKAMSPEKSKITLYEPALQ